MNQEFEDTLTERIIGIGIDVHRELGPGYLESIYEEAMAVGLTEAHLVFQRQVSVPVRFRTRVVGEHKLDLLVAREVVVELKAAKNFEDVHFAILRSYLRATGLHRGLLMNFAGTTLQVKRIGAEFRGKR